jgi:hypothetical protein
MVAATSLRPHAGRRQCAGPRRTCGKRLYFLRALALGAHILLQFPLCFRFCSPHLGSALLLPHGPRPLLRSTHRSLGLSLLVCVESATVQCVKVALKGIGTLGPFPRRLRHEKADHCLRNRHARIGLHEAVSQGGAKNIGGRERDPTGVSPPTSGSGSSLTWARIPVHLGTGSERSDDQMVGWKLAGPWNRVLSSCGSTVP